MSTTFDPSSRTGQLWQEMKTACGNWGKSVGQLTKEVDVGYVGDPLWLSGVENVKGRVEGPEVLEWCYGHGSCHPLLSRHGFPLPFAMNDFSGDNWFDDQKRHEIDRALKKFRGARDRKAAEEIYRWSLSAMHFNDDCHLESSDWQALLMNCGFCTETSSIMYYVYGRAGFAPRFYFESDSAPDMRWQDRYEKMGANFDMHVLVGLALKGGTVFVDRVNERFAGKHEFAVPISPRAMAGAVLGNFVTEKLGSGDIKAATESLELQMEMMPDDIMVYYRWVFVLLMTGEASREAAAEEMQRRFPDHPAAFFLEALIREGDAEVLKKLLDEKDPLRGSMERLKRASPRLASEMYFQLAVARIMELDAARRKILKAIKAGADANALLGPHVESINGVVDLLAMSFSCDPNAVRSYVAIIDLLENSGGDLPPVALHIAERAESLLVANPKHVPLRFLAARALNILQVKTGDRSFLRRAIAHLRKVTELEPDHPRAYLDLANSLLVEKRIPECMAALDRVRVLSGERVSEDYYKGKIAAYLNSGDGEGLKSVIEEAVNDRFIDGVDVILSFLESKFKIAVYGELDNLQVLRRSWDDSPIPRMVLLISEVLEKYPRAQLRLQSIYAKLAVFKAMTLGREGWREAAAGISEMGSQAVLESLSGELGVIDNWLTRSFQKEDVLDVQLEALEAMRADLPSSFAKQFVSIYVEVVNNYLALGKKEKAAAVWDIMLGIDSTNAVIYSVNRMLGVKYPSPQHYIDALDLLYDRRAFLAPEAMKMVRDAYEMRLSLSGLDSKTVRHVKRRIKVMDKGR